MNTRLLAMTVLPLGILTTMPHSANAVVLGISQQTLTSASDVPNSGIYVSGTNLGNANVATTINGVLFKPTQSGLYFEGPSNTPGTFRYRLGAAANSDTLYEPLSQGGGGSFIPEFETLFDSTNYRSPSWVDEIVVGLDPSRTYRIDMLMGDNRTIYDYTSNFTIRSGSFDGGSPGNYTTGSTIGTFTVEGLGGAPSATQQAALVSIYVTGETALDIYSGNTAIISGMALHMLVPEPTSLLLVGCVVAPALACRRRTRR